MYRNSLFGHSDFALEPPGKSRERELQPVDYNNDYASACADLCAGVAQLNFDPDATSSFTLVRPVAPTSSCAGMLEHSGEEAVGRMDVGTKLQELSRVEPDALLREDVVAWH